MKPVTVDEVVCKIISTLDSEAKNQIAKMTYLEFADMKYGLTVYVLNHLKEFGIELDGTKIYNKETDESGASLFIVEEVWRRLKETNELRDMK